MTNRRMDHPVFHALKQYVSLSPLDKMTAISHSIFSDAFREWKILYLIPKGPIGNNPALVYIMAWCRMAASHYLK